MTCTSTLTTTRPVINAINTVGQAAAANATLVFPTVVTKGTCINFTAGNGVFTIPCPGVYEVSFDADVTPVATGDVTVVIMNGTAEVPGAIASNQMTLAETTHVHVQGVVPVLKSCACINNTAQVSVVIGAAAAVTNSNIIIHRIA